MLRHVECKHCGKHEETRAISAEVAVEWSDAGVRKSQSVVVKMHRSEHVKKNLERLRERM